MKCNTLIVSDTEYRISTAYANGAKAMRNRIPWNCNPHREYTSSHEEWNYGHVNESAGVHSCDGVDVITAKRTGAIFRVDQ